MFEEDIRFDEVAREEGFTTENTEGTEKSGVGEPEVFSLLALCAL
jgi:hypothetical protein